MLYLTGDTHGDFHRFSSRAFPEQKTMTREDTVLICGDFGGLWDDSPRCRHLLDELERRPFTTAFVDGNHENFDLLDALPEERWNGGMIHRLRPNVIHLCRGYVFRIDGMRVFCMGGGKSHDMPGGVLPPGPELRRRRRQLDRLGIRYRVDHESWWAREMPSPEEYQRAIASLEAEDYMVDLVVTHSAPSDIQLMLKPRREANELTDFLMEIREKLFYRQWYCGHYHLDKHLGSERFRAMYESMQPEG